MVSCRSEQDKLASQIQDTLPGHMGAPLNIRIKELAKGNLLLNPSFESGKHYINDTLKLSFNLPGWKKVGDNVFWTNTEDKNNYNAFDASNGIHAIKISRQHANETDIQGEGIISDYIKVIPGNYSLRMDIRLENIKSNLDRFSTGIYDAVNIRIFYFDKNKVLIRKTALDPGHNTEVDPSFKGFNFSLNEDISKFGWNSIIARTGNFPFEEGNMPENTRYVKIFAGLKGTGEMWIDYLRFTYTRKNFTFLEQIQPYFDSTVERSVYLLPSPQKAESYSKIIINELSDSKSNNFPIFILPKNMDTDEKIIVNNFKNALIAAKFIPKNSNSFLSSYNQATASKASLIFSIGKNDLLKEFSENLPEFEMEEREQAYYIQRLESDPKYVFIDYTDAEGLSHAFNTLKQLIDVKEGIYHHYNIVDYPDFRQRNIILPENLIKFDQFTAKSINHLADCGINRITVSFPLNPERSLDYFRNSKIWELEMNKLKRTYPFLASGFMFKSFTLPETEKLISGKDDEALPNERKESIIRDAQLLAGVITDKRSYFPDFMMFSDQSLWDLESIDHTIEFDPLSFQNVLQYESSFWDAFSSSLKTDKSIPVYLQPVFRFNSHQRILSGLGKMYFDNITHNEQGLFTRLLWQGPVEFPEIIDFSDIFQFYGKKDKLVFYSTALSARKESCFTGSYYSIYSWRAVTGSLFEGMDSEFEGIQPDLFKGEMVFDIEHFNELVLIRLISAMDYLGIILPINRFCLHGKALECSMERL